MYIKGHVSTHYLLGGVEILKYKSSVEGVEYSTDFKAKCYVCQDIVFAAFKRYRVHSSLMSRCLDAKYYCTCIPIYLKFSGSTMQSEEALSLKMFVYKGD